MSGCAQCDIDVEALVGEVVVDGYFERLELRNGAMGDSTYYGVVDPYVRVCHVEGFIGFSYNPGAWNEIVVSTPRIYVEVT